MIPELQGICISPLFGIVGPSGSGKTSARRRVQEECGHEFIVSWTTRELRGLERNGVDYWGKTDAEFDQLLAAGGFLEHAQYGNKRYGTPKQPVIDAIKAGKSVLFDVDVRGARRLKFLFGDAFQTVFIWPSSFSALKRQLELRADLTPDQIEQRLNIARQEICYAYESDFIVANFTLAQLTSTICDIARAQQLANRRLAG